MLVAISYDIPCNKRRYRLAKLLSSYGERVQYSVFEAHLSPHQLLTLRKKVGQLIKPKEDSVRFYTLGESYDNKIMIEGLGVVIAKPNLLIF